MAFITSTSHITLADRWAEFSARLTEANAKRTLYRQTVSELSQLSSRELADLGIHRSQIKAIATEAAGY